VAESLKTQHFQRLENCGARRAALRPYFLRSLIFVFHPLLYRLQSLDFSRSFILSLSYRIIVFQIFVGVLWAMKGNKKQKPFPVRPDKENGFRYTRQVPDTHIITHKASALEHIPGEELSCNKMY
jgi:hypothetical protein